MNYCCTDEPQPAILRLPATANGGASEVECFYQEMRGQRLSLESPVPVPCSAAVSVKFEDALYLGEVVLSTPENGHWHLEVSVEQILSGLTSLMALREQLLVDRPVHHLAGVPVGSQN